MPNIFERLGQTLFEKGRELIRERSIVQSLYEVQRYEQYFSQIIHDYELLPQHDEQLRLTRIESRTDGGKYNYFWIVTAQDGSSYFINPQCYTITNSNLNISSSNEKILLETSFSQPTIGLIKNELESMDSTQYEVKFFRVLTGNPIQSETTHELQSPRFAV